MRWRGFFYRKGTEFQEPELDQVRRGVLNV